MVNGLERLFKLRLNNRSNTRSEALTVKAQRHDKQDAIKGATQLFWQKGFHATSMRNIQDHIDLRPGSIYASFGSKEGLFKESLNCYAQTSLERLASYAEAMPVLEALKRFITEVVCRTGNTSPSDMCMLAKTVAELTQDNEELLEEAKMHLRRIESAFAQLLSQAQCEGLITQDKDPQRLASFLQIQLMGLQAYSRVNTESAHLQAFVDEAFERLVS